MANPNTTKSFKATLERDNRALGWVIAFIPFDVRKAWGTARPRVKGEINGFAFRTSLFPIREGGHFLLVNKQMQKGAHVAAGSVAQFRLEPDTQERVAVIGPELKRILAQSRALRSAYEEMSYSMRYYISNWIGEVKSAAARARRADQFAERMLSMLEAEQELPPILRIAFAQRPGAQEGWERMSRSHRRHELLSIFYYKSPEARARRVEKLVAEALAFAEKPSSKRRRTDKPRAGKPRTAGRRTDKARTDKPWAGRPRTDKPRTDKRGAGKNSRKRKP
jgi:uncharacterized protein YdeI (YjbR/CyaY-like superfamily)